MAQRQMRRKYADQVDGSIIRDVRFGGEENTVATWLDDIKTAMTNLGGVAHYEQLYPEVRRIRGSDLPSSWKQIIQRNIQDHSSDSEGFLGVDVFYAVEGIGSGVWGLRSFLHSTPQASDLGTPEPAPRVRLETYRVLRDTELARKLKAFHKNICQICGETVKLSDAESYSEAHHIRPLGNPHNGPDIAENIVVLCPNHHVLFDYGAMPLDIEKVQRTHGHVIGMQYVRYHNEVILKKPTAAAYPCTSTPD